MLFWYCKVHVLDDYRWNGNLMYDLHSRFTPIACLLYILTMQRCHAIRLLQYEGMSRFNESTSAHNADIGKIAINFKGRILLKTSHLHYDMIRWY